MQGRIARFLGAARSLRMKSVRLLVIVVAGLISAAVGQGGNSVDTTFQRLAKVDRFAFGGIGYAGVTSQGEKDYKLVLSRPSAMDDFEKLLAIGNPQAKSYALVGIRSLNPKRYEELSRPFHDSKDNVVTQSGCIEWREPLSKVLQRIEAGEYSKLQQRRYR